MSGKRDKDKKPDEVLDDDEKEPDMSIMKFPSLPPNEDDNSRRDSKSTLSLASERLIAFSPPTHDFSIFKKHKNERSFEPTEEELSAEIAATKKEYFGQAAVQQMKKEGYFGVREETVPDKIERAENGAYFHWNDVDHKKQEEKMQQLMDMQKGKKRNVQAQDMGSLDLVSTSRKKRRKNIGLVAAVLFVILIVLVLVLVTTMGPGSTAARANFNDNATVTPTLSPVVGQEAPTGNPVLVSTPAPTFFPTKQPTPLPTSYPSKEPTDPPTLAPTVSSPPGGSPTNFPFLETAYPSVSPTANPTRFPVVVPTAFPSTSPTVAPTPFPTK